MLNGRGLRCDFYGDVVVGVATVFWTEGLSGVIVDLVKDGRG